MPVHIFILKHTNEKYNNNRNAYASLRSKL